jgi:hypothetical protein
MTLPASLPSDDWSSDLTTPADTTAAANAAVCGSGGNDGPGVSADPSEILLASIVALLAPLFTSATSDADLARLAAIETFASYKARTQIEWLSIAQIVAFGLAAVDNLRLAMTADLSLPMKLRLRGCANALNRSAQQNLRALEKYRAKHLPRVVERAAMPVACGATDDEIAGSDVKAKADHAHGAVTQVHARAHDAPSDHQPVAARSVVAPSVVAPSVPARSVVAPSVVAPSVVAPSVVASSAVAAAFVAHPVVAQPVAAEPEVAGSVSHRSGAILSMADTTDDISIQSECAPTPAGRSAGLSRGPESNLMWASAMNKVATELMNNAAPPIAQPVSKSDLMWANTLASVARHMVDDAGRTPGGVSAARQHAGTPPRQS